jgi:hypothetical protein
LAQRSGSKTTADAGGDKDSRLECAGVQTARGPHVDRLLLGTGGGWRDPLAYRGRYDGFGVRGMLSRARLSVTTRLELPVVRDGADKMVSVE